MNIKNILLGGLIPMISLASPEAGKTISDAKSALDDGHLSEDEAKVLFTDAIGTAKSFWPEGATVLDDLKRNIEVDLPNIEKTIADFKILTEKKSA